MTGNEIRKENRAADSRSKLRVIPPVIVEPDLEMPGKMARIEFNHPPDTKVPALIYRDKVRNFNVVQWSEVAVDKQHLTQHPNL